MKSKWLFFCIALLSLSLGVLPEFISDEMKAKAKSVFGNHYDVAWLIIFLLVAALFIYLSWKQFKSEKGSFLQESTIPEPPTKIDEKKGSNLVVEDFTAEGIDFKFHSDQAEDSNSFKNLIAKKGNIKIDVKKK